MGQVIIDLNKNIVIYILITLKEVCVVLISILDFLIYFSFNIHNSIIQIEIEESG
jgi:hypothetical protein